MSKIKVNEVVELLGDEMARVIWDAVKELFILPYLDIDLKTYDVSIQRRGELGDSILVEAVEMLKKYHVGVMCPKLNPNPEILKAYKISKKLQSPLTYIRHALNCALIREPILCKNVPRSITSWKKPIIIMRHPQYDQYQATELALPCAGSLEFVFTDRCGNVTRKKIKDMKSKGVAIAMFNTEASMTNFAKLAFEYALERELPLIFSTKHSLLNIYDGRFKRIFEKIYKDYEKQFEEKGLTFKVRLTDEMMANVITAEGGFIWACKNYDGDVHSDIICQGFGSPGLMMSSMKCPDRKTFVTEPYHGTLSQEYQNYLDGKSTSCNPTGIIYAWANALAYRGKMDDDEELIRFCDTLKQAAVDIIDAGNVTKDVAKQIHGYKDVPQGSYFETFEYLNLVKEHFDELLNK